MKRMIAVVVAAALLGVVFVFGITRDPLARDNIASPFIDREMPDFSMELSERYSNAFGETLTRSDKAGQPMVVNFWASWCLPCRDEAPVLEAAWREHQGDVMIIGVNTQESQRRNAEGFLDEFGLSFPNGFDAQNRIGIDYGIFGLPETFFIRADGTLNYKHAGPVTDELMNEQIQALLD